MISRHKLKYLLFFMTWAAFFVAGNAHSALKIQPLKSRVNDYAGMLSGMTAKKLEADLQKLEQSDSTQIAILTIPSLSGEPMEDFSIRVAEAWKIGQKTLDNGAILIISKNDRKMRIEVGYGLEGRLTDLVCGRIIRNTIVPAFRSGNFNKGITAGVNAMIAAVRGEYKPKKRQHDSGTGNPQGMIFVLFAFVFLISQLGRVRRKVGTVAGGVLLPFFSAMFFSSAFMTLLIMIPIGLAAGFILSALSSAMGARMPSSRTGTGRGGITSGGFGGAGFGGGGGGFGGGGASGGW